MVYDRQSNACFLVDTGSDQSCFPKKLLPGRRLADSLCLSAANGIPTYGCVKFQLHLNNHRTFVWRFIVANVAITIIGADFLAHFGLLPDCRRGCIVDGHTGRSFPSARVVVIQRSIKHGARTSSYHDRLAEFPVITDASRRPLDLNYAPHTYEPRTAGLLSPSTPGTRAPTDREGRFLRNAARRRDSTLEELVGVPAPHGPQEDAR